MKNKFFIASTLALSVMGGLNQANAQDGTITFTGSIQDKTCSIAFDSKDITVDFGVVSATNATGPTPKKGFNIELISCPASVSSATIAINGEHASGATTGQEIMDYVDGVAVMDGSSYWAISNASDKRLNIDGTTTADNNYPLTSGNNTIQMYVSMPRLAGTPSRPVGSHTGEATYTVIYQ